MSEATPFRLAALTHTPSTRVAEIEARARATGYAAGYTAGVRQATATVDAERAELARQHQAATAQQNTEYAARIAALNAAITAANERSAPVLAAAENALYAAAIDLAEAVLARELTTGPGSAHDALTRVLNTPASAPVSNVRMNPADIASLNEAGEQIPESIRLVEDSTVMVGDAVSEHESGHLDARVSEALTRAKFALAGQA